MKAGQRAVCEAWSVVRGADLDMQMPALVPGGIDGREARIFSGRRDNRPAALAKPPDTPFASKCLNGDSVMGKSCRWCG